MAPVVDGAVRLSDPVQNRSWAQAAWKRGNSRRQAPRAFRVLTRLSRRYAAGTERVTITRSASDDLCKPYGNWNPMDRDKLFQLLDEFKIETPSWGYADTGTRFGKFLQPAAAATIEEKLADAGTVHRYTGCCPTVAVHVLWDFSIGVDATATAELARSNGIRIGSINPNLFQDQIYKFGSVVQPRRERPAHAHRHVIDCINIAQAVGSNLLSLWFADGTNYPGQDDITARKHRMHGALRQWHDAMPAGMTMLVEYKPFEPAFYHTDIADWGMSYVFARDAGPNAKVLVDTGHHLPGSQHRAHRRVPAGRGNARRLPFQRPQVRRRRPDPRQHRPVRGLPDLPRDPQRRRDARPGRVARSRT